MRGSLIREREGVSLSNGMDGNPYRGGDGRVLYHGGRIGTLSVGWERSLV